VRLRRPALAVALATVTALIGAGAATIDLGAPVAGASLPNATPTSPTGLYRQGALLPSGRLASPAGVVSTLGDFPVAATIDPTGSIAVVANSGQGEGGVDQGNESLQVIALRPHPTLVQTVEDHVKGQDTFYNAGVVFSPDGTHLYATGGGNDAVYDYTVTNQRLQLAHSWVSTKLHQTSYPTDVGDAVGYSRGIAITPDGSTLVVTNEQGGSVAALSTTDGSIKWQTPLGGSLQGEGSYPGAVALTPDGTRAWVTAQGANLLMSLDVSSGAPGPVVPVGDHPNAVAITHDGNTAYVTDANDDSLSVVDIGASVPALRRQLSTKLLAGEANGASPDAVAIDEARKLVYVANAGDDTVSVIGASLDASTASLDANNLQVLGDIPTAWYPTAVAVQPNGQGLLIASAKGYGGVPVTKHSQYDGNDMVGMLQQVSNPTASTLSTFTQRAKTALTWGTRANSLRTSGNPIPTDATAGQSPIKHVVLVVRENRTFDQVFGDLNSQGWQGVDTDPNFVEFGRTDPGTNKTVTPNAHDLAGRFGISDNFYSDGEASIQGHDWTTQGITSDYTEKSWLHYYSARNHPYDPVAPIIYPRCGALFQQMAAHHISFRNFGELEGQITTQAPTAQVAPGVDCAKPGGRYDKQAVANTDEAYPNNLTLTSIKDTDRLTEFETTYKPLVSADTVPSFTYAIMGNDHTDGTTAGDPTPQALVATNDQAVGGLVDYLSHTPQWSSTAVFVMEDDSQDGLDHRDGHRNVLIVASPWAKRHAVSHVHVSQAGIIHTIELILGLPPMTEATQYAPVPYDLFTNTPDNSPYTMEMPTYDQNAVNPSAASGSASSVHVDTSRIDVAGPVLEAQLWEATRLGTPLPAPLARELLDRGNVTREAVRAWQEGHACDCDPRLSVAPRPTVGGSDADG
jgi:DNA-binding beta-propeller fold protein YncE